jgi:hypothetical protein
VSWDVDAHTPVTVNLENSFQQAYEFNPWQALLQVRDDA